MKNNAPQTVHNLPFFLSHYIRCYFRNFMDSLKSLAEVNVLFRRVHAEVIFDLPQFAFFEINFSSVS